MDYSSDVESRKSKKKKVDPSFKSKRYRDKLRAEVKALENLIPVDRPTLNKKLDSQTIYRLAIAFLRVKTYVKARHLQFEPASPWSRSRQTGANYAAQPFDKCPKYGVEQRIQDEPTPSQQDRSLPGTLDEIVAGLGNKVESLLDPATLYQIIDGFVILASADGTIMFVTENISKYTGFSQVDLIHRCLYSIVHPDDFQDVRDALETQQTRKKNEGIIQPDHYEHPSDNIDSLFCRLRCYHGNTPGYIKLHCRGKYHHLPDMPKTTQTSKSIVLLYCQPFLKTGNDVIDDGKKDVFWSKHDLDLRFKEIEETPVLGYSTSDVCGKSLYQYVHPEDLCILDNVHRAVTRITEVQTFFFRLQMKQGGWIWMYCKGKVICKNSKKFSIVFSHCPVRDGDNVFIKQETLIRRHKLASFLQSLEIPVSQTYSQQVTGEQQNQCQFRSQQGFESVLQLEHTPLANDENVLDIHSIPCPSSWHADTDRHSPVLPNNHAAQKTLHRERQLYIAEYRRKQYFEQKKAMVTSLQPRNDLVTNPRTCPEQFHSVYSVVPGSSCSSQQDNLNSNVNTPRNWRFPYTGCTGDYGSSYSFPSNYSCHQDLGSNNVYFMPPYHSNNHLFSPHNQKLEYFENLNRLGQRTEHPTNAHAYDNCGQEVHQGKQCFVSPNVHNFYSSANVRFSMVCNQDFNTCKPVTQDNVYGTNDMRKTFETNKGASSELIKSEAGNANCCAILSENEKQAVTQSVKYDVEASIYMRIVEAQNTGSSHTTKEFPVCNSLVS